MTLREALDRRIPRVRMPNWACQTDYLRLPLLANGYTGPWAELYADTTQEILGVAVGSQCIPVITPDVLDAEGYEAYTGPVSPHEQDAGRFAKNYQES